MTGKVIVEFIGGPGKKPQIKIIAHEDGATCGEHDKQLLQYITAASGAAVNDTEKTAEAFANRPQSAKPFAAEEEEDKYSGYKGTPSSGQEMDAGGFGV